MREIRTEVMRNRFAAIVEEAAIVLYKTAYTTFVKQTQDYQCALMTIEGDVFAYPRLSGTTANVALSIKATLDLIGMDTIRPGDVIITNDPFSTKGMVTHLTDVHTIRPIYYNGELVCFAWAFLHASDIGGSVPGSISPMFHEVFQEGLRLRPVRLYTAGVLNEALLGLIQDNSRIPEPIWGDIRSMCSALGSMDRRIVALCERYGLAEIEAGIADVLAYAEDKARKAISTIPDGTWSFVDYLESIPGRPIMIHCTLTVAGGDLTLDFSGSSPQVPVACNFVNAPRPSPALSRTILSYILTMEPDTPMNGGMTRSMRVVAPKGMIVNAEYPAAMGNRAITLARVYDVVLGCLNQAVPGGLTAAGGSQAAIIAAAITDRRTRHPKVSVVEPMIGGSGGRRNCDGVDGLDIPFSNLRSAPIEAVEAEMPLLVRTFGLTPDSFGAGTYRGGAALEIVLECCELEMTVTVRGCDRLNFQPWGLVGGAAGMCGTAELNGRELSLFEALHLKLGDRLYLRSPTGGGFGDPLERDAAAVLADVRDGLLTAAAAKGQYGVIVVENAIAESDTKELRRARKTAGTPSLFTFGERREAFERDWPPAIQVELATRLLLIAPGLRHAVKAEVERRLPTGATVSKVIEALEGALTLFNGNPESREAHARS